jgi:hypothetical protein
MLKSQNIIKRFCHHHSRDIFSIPKLSNPLVECEYNKKKIESQETKPLPIQVHCSEKNKLYTIVIELSK